MRPIRRLPLAAALFWTAISVALQRVECHPDGVADILPFCTDLRRQLTADTLVSARDAYQRIRGLNSIQLQQDLGRQLLEGQQDLAQWREGNATRLQQLLAPRQRTSRDGGHDDTAWFTHCLGGNLHPAAFSTLPQPTVSMLLEFFKRPGVITPLAERLASSCSAARVTCELVVNADSPHEAGAWAQELAAMEDGVTRWLRLVPVFSANVHEARGYNRAARAARGKYLVIFQDDELPPADGTWLQQLDAVFSSQPSIGIIGMNTYRLCRPKEWGNKHGRPAWLPDDRIGGAHWTYAQVVDFAPFAIRASTWRDLGGLDEGVSNKGDCGITSDFEISMRAWIGGWKVAYMYLDGMSGHGEEGSTHKAHTGSAEKCWVRQMDVGQTVLGRRYGSQALVEEVCNKVWALNMVRFWVPHLVPGADGSGAVAAGGSTGGDGGAASGPKPQCPYGESLHTRFANCSQPSEQVLASLGLLGQL